MQIRHANQGEETSAAIRGGDREFKTLLVGDENSPDNFRLVLARQSGKVVAPRHRHNFDQIRMCLSGDGQNYGPDHWIRPGEIVYFPEGVPYGEDSDCTRQGVTLQFGGASGNGFLSSRRTKQGMEELKQFGTFDKGVFYRNDPAPGQRRNQDSFEAVWEHVNRRKLDYPKPRYDEPIMMRPQNFDWQPSEQSGLSIKPLGSFTERRVEIALLKLSLGTRARISPRPGRQVAFVIHGAGRLGGEELRQHSAFVLDPREGADIDATAGMEMLLIGLPIFATETGVVSDAA